MGPHIPFLTYERLRKKVQRLEKEALRRKQGRKVLRKSEERYRMIFNHCPLGIVHLDSNGIVLDCNESLLEIVGAPKEKVIGSTMTGSLQDREMKSAVVAGLAGKPDYFEGHYLLVPGDKVTPVRAVFSRITAEDGRFLGAVGLVEDITERKNSEQALRKSQEFLGKIVNSINDHIFVKDRQHRLILVNDAECALAGRERDDLIGRTDYDFFPKDQVDVFWENDEIVFETGQENENEEEITDAQGRTRTIVTKKTLYTDKAGDKFLVGIIRDITERKQAELALKAAHRELQDIIEFLPDATFVINRDKKVLYWNRAMEEMTGIKKQDIIGQTDYAYAVPFYGERRPLLIDIVKAEDPEIEKRYDYVQRKGMALRGEAFVEGARQGKGAYLWATAAPLLSEKGNIVGYIQSIRDISDRKKAEEALRQSEEKYRQLFETVSDAILVLDGETRRFIEVNEKACRLYGYSREEFLELVHADITVEPDSSNASMEETLSGKRTHVPLRYHKKKDGTLFPAEISSSTFILAGRRVMCGVVRDITKRRQAEIALRQSEERLRELAENIRDVFWVTTPHELLYVSPAYEKIWGRSCSSLYEDPASFLESVHPEDRDRVRKALIASLEGKAPGYEEYRLVRPDESVRWIRARSFPISEQGKIVRTVGIAEDVTTLKQAEEFLCIERDLAFKLGAADSLVEAMKYLLEACFQLEGLDSGGVYLLERETGVFRLIYHQGLSDAFVERVSLYEPASLQAYFAMQGEPGYWSRPFDILEMGGILEREDLMAFIAIPVKYDGEVVALLNLASHELPEIPKNARIALEAIAAYVGGIISRVRLVDTIKAQGERLQEANTALKVLLKRREEDRTELEESLLKNVKHLVMPYLEKLKRSRLTGDQRNFLEILESHLREISSPFVNKLSAPMLGLTPTEIRVADLIRQGRSSKEIAELLGISERAAVFHRQGIRGKLGLTGKKLNLQTYLSTLQ